MGTEEPKQFPSGSHPASYRKQTLSPYSQPGVGDSLPSYDLQRSRKRWLWFTEQVCGLPQLLLVPQRLADTWVRDAQQGRVMTVTRPERGHGLTPGPSLHRRRIG